MRNRNMYKGYLFVGALIFREAIGLNEAVGAVLVISAGILVAVLDLRRAKKSNGV